MTDNPDSSIERIRSRLHEVIFEADTPAGKFFDIGLIVAIILSVIAVMLDSVADFRAKHGPLLNRLEWTFTILFSIEYILRLLTIRRPLKYATSFFGIVDLLAVLPTYLALVFPGTEYFLVIRILRLLRIFRVLKLARFTSEANLLMRAMRQSLRKIIVFLSTVATLVVIFGSLMYVIEGEQGGFTSIPVGVYWSIVTLTTVGYGDIAPQTPFGQLIAAIVMVLGFSIIAVPTGIVTSELTQAKLRVSTQSCPECSAEGHDEDARHCKMCGSAL